MKPVPHSPSRSFFIVSNLAATGIVCVDNHLRHNVIAVVPTGVYLWIQVGGSRILWIWRHTKPLWVRREACGYATYGFRIHSRHTTVHHTGVEAWLYAAILQDGNKASSEKTTMFGPIVECRWSLTDNLTGHQPWLECWHGTATGSHIFGLNDDGDCAGCCGWWKRVANAIKFQLKTY